MTQVRKLLVLGCLFLCGQLLIAQESSNPLSLDKSIENGKIIEGSVRAEDGSLLIGASIKIPGTSLNTIVDEKGSFQLEVPQEYFEKDSLEISHIIMASQKIALSSIKSPLQIELKYPTIKALDIVSYGSVCRRTLVCGGHTRGFGCGMIINKINQDLPNKIVTRPEQFAHGKIVIRCGSSISSNGPLYVIDGVPFTELSGSPFNTLAPEDIQEITILKGNVASAIYGSRGNYGVIIIVTDKKRSYGNLKYFSYAGLLGLAQMNETVLASPQMSFSQSLKFTKKTSSDKFNISGNMRQLPGFEENQHRKHFGGSAFYSRLALDKKLEVGARLSFNHIREKTPVLADVVKKNAEEVQYATRSFNNYFSQAFAKYEVSNYLNAHVDLSRYQNENLLFDRLGGNFFKPRLTFDREFNYRHHIKAEGYFSTQAISSGEQTHLKQLSAGLKATYKYDRLLEGELIIRKEDNSLLSQAQQLPAQYLSARARVNYDDLDLDPGGICAVSRGYLQAQANLNQTPFFNQNTFALGSLIKIGHQFSLNTTYTFASEQRANSPIPQDINILGFFPAAYQVLENQGLEIAVTFFQRSGDFFLDSRLDYHRGNGLAREMMSFNNRIEWRKLEFETGLEGFKGWKLSGGERDFFRLSFMDLTYNLKNIPKLNLHNVKLSLSGQNLLSLGDQQVWKDQLELSRLRDPSQFPVPLARNILFGVKMDIM